MSSHIDQSVPRVVGDTSSDRPATPSKDTDFYDLSTNTGSFFTGGSWRSSLPTITVLASVTALSNVAVASRYNGMIAELTDGSLWRFVSASTLTGDNLLVVTPVAGTGRWVLLPGSVDVPLPVTSGTADGAVLLTLQSGMRLIPRNAYWDVTSAFTGGSASALGASSNKAGFTTNGWLAGGTTGDVAATLTVGVTAGFIGLGINTATAQWGAIFVSGDTVKLNRITSAFTTGAGNLHVVGSLVANTG
jgi:hypothetical protein